MKSHVNTHAAQSATSLPRAPRDEAASRFLRYGITMSIRTACFILMAVVQPFGWWTWVFAAGAIFLPYVAVVVANVGAEDHVATVIPPERGIEAPRAADSATTASPTSAPVVIRLSESSPLVPAPRPAAHPPPPAPDERTARS